MSLHPEKFKQRWWKWKKWQRIRALTEVIGEFVQEYRSKHNLVSQLGKLRRRIKPHPGKMKKRIVKLADHLHFPHYEDLPEGIRKIIERRHRHNKK